MNKRKHLPSTKPLTYLVLIVSIIKLKLSPGIGLEQHQKNGLANIRNTLMIVNLSFTSAPLPFYVYIPHSVATNITSNDDANLIASLNHPIPTLELILFHSIILICNNSIKLEWHVPEFVPVQCISI